MNVPYLCKTCRHANICLIRMEVNKSHAYITKKLMGDNSSTQVITDDGPQKIDIPAGFNICVYECMNYIPVPEKKIIKDIDKDTKKPEEESGEKKNPADNRQPSA